MDYFTSDLHFGHKRIIELCSRPFDSVSQMEETIINNFNHILKPKDKLYILGDVAWVDNSPERIGALLDRIHATKILIKGNHDTVIPHECFEEVCDYKVIKYHGRDISLFHFPIESWHHANFGGIHLHGHIHEKASYNIIQREEGKLRYDVGVDANNFKPVSINDIFEFFST